MLTHGAALHIDRDLGGDTLMGFHEQDRRRALEIVDRIIEKFKGRMCS